MACETKLWLMLLLLLFAATCMWHCIHGKPQVPCLFIFGDSSSDPGNNNYIPVTSKVNYPPYGVNFPNGVTGRYNNGKTTIDMIVELLGIPNFIPPYANPHISDILLGVNYALAGAGINDQTGSDYGKIFSPTNKINNHKSVFLQIASELKSEEKTRKHLNQCLYYLDIGTNDYLDNNFGSGFFTTSLDYTTQQWVDILHKEYYQHLKVLYAYGARNCALSRLGFLGCRPFQISQYETEGCVESINDAVQLFNVRIRPLIDRLNKEYEDSKFIFVNYTTIQSSIFCR